MEQQKACEADDTFVQDIHNFLEKNKATLTKQFKKLLTTYMNGIKAAKESGILGRDKCPGFKEDDQFKTIKRRKHRGMFRFLIDNKKNNFDVIKPMLEIDIDHEFNYKDDFYISDTTLDLFKAYVTDLWPTTEIADWVKSGPITTMWWLLSARGKLISPDSINALETKNVNTVDICIDTIFESFDAGITLSYIVQNYFKNY